TILPEKSAKDLVDSRLHQAFLLESGLMDLFPLTFEIFGPGEIKEGAAKGILPPLGLDRLTKWVREHIPLGVIESNLMDIDGVHKYSKKMRRWYRGIFLEYLCTPSISI